jgi:hypothetical protein
LKISSRVVTELVVLLACAGLGIVSAISIASKERGRLQEFHESMASVTVVAPTRRPIPSQEDLEIALALYSIDVPSYLGKPVFDPDLEDRGLTTGSTLHGPSSVFAGPAAFTSWAILGSTLGHEIEVHGRQNFLAIALQDDFFRLVANVSQSGFALASIVRTTDKPAWNMCNGCGTLQAEREAYGYEIANTGRFGLTHEEVRLIRQVMDTYYPEQTGLAAQPTKAAK